jgi:hypothetical protein
MASFDLHCRQIGDHNINFDNKCKATSVLVRLSIGLIGCSQGNIYGYTKPKEFENGQKCVTYK